MTARPVAPGVRRRLRVALVPVLLAAGLAGCGSVAETVADLNPLRERETPLPGEREPFFSTNSAPGVEVAGGTASVGPPRANPDWPQPGGNARNDPGHVAFAGGANRVWRVRIGGTGGGVMSFTRDTLRIAARPVVAGGRVYVYTPDGAVTAVSLSSGNRVWQTAVRPEDERDAAAGGGVAVDGGRVFVATGYGEVAALDPASGAVQWRREIIAPARSAPTAAAGKVFLVTQTNEVVALEQADGSQSFSYVGIPEQAGMLAAASPAVSGNKVVFPYSSGEVMAFDIESGEAVWQDFVTRTIRTLAISGIADVSGSPVISDGTVYATGVSGRTIAVSLADGTRRWENDLGGTSTPVVSGNAMFIVDLDGRMVAMDRSDGSVLWATPLPRPNKRRDEAWSGPVLAGSSLWAISNDGRLAAVDPADGRIKSDTDVGTAGYLSPIVAGERMIVVTDAGEISAFR